MKDGRDAVAVNRKNVVPATQMRKRKEPGFLHLTVATNVRMVANGLMVRVCVHPTSTDNIVNSM
jgi:hypothetical protein